MTDPRPFVLNSSKGKLIRGDVHVPTKGEPATIVVICHGFKGFKDWGFFPHLATSLCHAGFIAVRFNFSMNGIEDDLETCSDAESFAMATYSQELSDLHLVLDAIEGLTNLPQGTEAKNLVLLGHSRGGGIALVKAAEDERISAVVTLAAVCDFDRWGERTKSLWREQGYIEVTNTRTKQVLKLYPTLLDDLESNRERLDIKRAVSALAKPLLIIHGESDVSVPVEEAKNLYDSADRALTKLELIPRADHTFGVVHPFAGETPELRRLLDVTVAWLQEAFTSGMNPR